MFNLLTALFAVVDSRVWSVQKLRGWSDAWLAVVEVPAVWLADLSMISSHQEAAEILSEASAEGKAPMVRDSSYLGLLLGMEYRKFMDGLSSLEQFIAAVGGILDGEPVPFQIDVEGWYMLMEDADSIPPYAGAMLAPLLEMADAVLERLESQDAWSEERHVFEA